MAQGEAREVVLEIRMTDELRTALETLRENARSSPALVPKGLSCSESSAGDVVIVAAESAFVTLPGACVIKTLGAIEIVGSGPVFEDGAHSKSLILRTTAEGWRFSVKFVAPVARDRKKPRT